MMGLVLGIETSCDETAAAVVDEDFHVLSSVIESSIDQHRAFGGVVPELAGRAHVATIGPVVRRALLDAGLNPQGPAILGIAVTSGPGLIGSLLVGLSAAKAYALAWGVPFVGVNHLEGHLFAPLLEQSDLEWPLMTLLVSGGHSLIVLQSGPGEHQVLGETIDDAAGEAYDKVARWLGLGYPGGPEIDHLAQSGVAGALKLPQSMTGDGYDLSFSGLKTAVLQAVRAATLSEQERADVAFAVQDAIVATLCTKALRALAYTGHGALVVAGGVGANRELRQRLTHEATALGAQVYFPRLEFCTDNAAMIAVAGLQRLRAHEQSSGGIEVRARWPLSELRPPGAA